MSTDWGPSNDERFQVPYGEQALDYYTSFTKNDSVLDYKIEPLMKNYGAFVDMLPEAIHRITGSDLMTTRHIIFALLGFLYIFFGALIAKRIGGWNAAYIALALLIFLPRVFGETFNNPKDPPFAAAYLISIYAFMVFFDSLPKPNRRAYLILFLGFLCTMLVRVSGLLVLLYFALFLLLELYKHKKLENTINYFKVFRNIFIAGVFGYFSSILFWPSMMNNPIWQPLDALKMLSQYPITLRNLWEGKYIMSDTIPWYYNLKYFLISNPEITLLGILLGFVLLWKMVKKYNIYRIALLLFASLFPFFYLIIKGTALLTGWRHSYFIFVPLVIFAAIAFAYVLDHIAKNKLQKGIVVAIIAIGLLFPARFMASNYGYFYTYFNDVSGGTKSAMGEYELDYYSHAVKPALDWIIKNVPDYENKIIACNNNYQVNELLATYNKKVTTKYVRYRERYDTDWDYAIMTQSFVDADYLKNGRFPPKGTIHTIKADDAPICAVIKREDKNDLLGKQAIDSTNFPQAIKYLSDALRYNPDNEIAWTNLGLAQLNTGQGQQAVQSLTNALKITPESMMAKNYLAYAYMQTGNTSYAISTLLNLIEENPGMPDPYRMLGQIYQQQGNSQMAQQYNNAYQQIMSQRQGR
jgi:Flp pilus assembly protein TadD